jgi:protein-L-isoaspartate(D-aspartate) O-methyltransferase
MSLHQSRDELLRELQREGIESPRVLAAMAAVPRERFLDPDLQDRAYANTALPIDCGQTISQPYIVALMTEALALTGTERVLEIGTGSGYQAAILSRLAAEVITIERHPQLSQLAAERLQTLGCRNVTCLVGDGSLGWPDEAPYDGLIVTAAMPQSTAGINGLLSQLVVGGRLVAPLGDETAQRLFVLTRTGDGVQTRELCDCRFVPLIGQYGQPDHAGESSSHG